MRRRGHASQALKHLCRILLESTPAVCLFVRPENTPAIRLYESAGGSDMEDPPVMFTFRLDAEATQ